MLRAAGAAKAFGTLGPAASGAIGNLDAMAGDRKRRLSKLYALYAFVAQKNSLPQLENIPLAISSGADVLTLSCTNGAPVVTVTKAPPGLVSRSPTTNWTFSVPLVKPVATNGLPHGDAPAIERKNWF